MSDMPSPHRGRDDTHTVRPRWSWIALAVLLVGLLLIATGIAVQSWWPAVPGLVLLVVGGAFALHGGFFYDVQGGGSFKDQMHDVVSGDEHEFPGAGAKRSEDEVKQDVRRRWLGRKA
jgi:hypothetical protein